MLLTYQCRDCGELCSFEYPDKDKTQKTCGKCYREKKTAPHLRLMASEVWAHMEPSSLSIGQALELHYYSICVLQNYVDVQPYVCDPHVVNNVMRQTAALMRQSAEMLHAILSKS